MSDKVFRIIENPLPNFYDKYEDFIKLYNNHSITIVDIRKELGWTVKTYSRARVKALEEGRIVERRGVGNGRPRKKKHIPKNYYYRKSINKFVISKRFNIDGKSKSVYYGAYNNKEECIKIIEELKKCDWDKNQLESIKIKLGIV